MADPLADKNLAGYQVERLLNRGGMGVVYLAKDLRLNRKVALKLLAPELTADDTFRRRFERESQMAASIDHPNIVPIYASGEADGFLFIAMRFVEGSDLKQVLSQDPTPDIDYVLSVTGQVASALDAAHERDLVHRDVKPGNVLLGSVGRGRLHHVYLADFGLTKRTRSRSGLTGTGQFLGTIDYMAPEQVQSHEVDGRADVYALGCLLYECLTGEVPFDRPTDAGVLLAHISDDPPEVTERRADLPPEMDEVVAKALAKDPDDRFDTCGELAEAAINVLAPLAQEAVAAARTSRAVAGPAPSASAPPAATDAGPAQGRTQPVTLHDPGPSEESFPETRPAVAPLAAPPGATVPDAASPESPRHDHPSSEVLEEPRTTPAAESPPLPAGPQSHAADTPSLQDQVGEAPSSEQPSGPFEENEAAMLPETAESQTPSGPGSHAKATQAPTSRPEPGPRTRRDLSPQRETGKNRRPLAMWMTIAAIVLTGLTFLLQELAGDPTGESPAPTGDKGLPTDLQGGLVLSGESRSGSAIQSVSPAGEASEERPLPDRAVFSFSLDGFRLAYALGSRVVIEDEGRRRVQLKTGNVLDLAWDPNGALVVTSSGEGGHFELLRVAPGSTRPEPLPVPGWVRLSDGIDVSRDGSIVMSLLGPEREPALYLLDSESKGALKPIPIDGLAPSDPKWAPDASHIAFRADVEGQTGLYTVSAEGDTTSELVVEEGLEMGPAWALDGSVLGYGVVGEAGLSLRAVARDGEPQFRIVDLPGLACHSCVLQWIDRGGQG